MPISRSTVEVRTGVVRADGAELYYEVRGAGPPVSVREPHTTPKSAG